MQAIADFNHNDFTRSGMAEADKGLLVKFFIQARQDPTASAQEGRPIFKDVEFVDIKIPGNRNAGACRPATEADKNRFSEHYRKFKERISDEDTIGTPLNEWPAISRSQAEELSFFHVKTVEQLATMNDTQASKFMGLTALRERAKKWLEVATKEKPILEMNKRLQEQENEIKELKQALKNMLELQKPEVMDSLNKHDINLMRREAKVKST